MGICALSCWSHGHHQAPGAGREKPASPVSSFPDALSLPLLHDHGQTCFSLFPPQDTRCPLFDFAGVLPELFVFLAPLLFIWNTRSGSRLLRPVFLHLLPGPYLSSSLKFTHTLSTVVIFQPVLSVDISFLPSYKNTEQDRCPLPPCVHLPPEASRVTSAWECSEHRLDG